MKGKPSASSVPPDIAETFREWILQPEFPCVGAKAAFHAGSYDLRVYEELAAEPSTTALARDLLAFAQSDMVDANEYATFVAIFQAPTSMDEAEFEQRLWSQLTQLNRIDAAKFRWDPSVRSDPSHPQFSFSFAGQALYVIGLHANSSRDARTFPWPALVFNPHEQFERLRTDGKWKRMQNTIRERDVQLQGTVNPMLSDFGQSSEARQYSGRAVEENWQPTFQAAKPAPAGKCPFHH